MFAYDAGALLDVAVRTVEQLAAYLAPLSPLDAVNYIGSAAPAAVLV